MSVSPQEHQDQLTTCKYGNNKKLQLNKTAFNQYSCRSLWDNQGKKLLFDNKIQKNNTVLLILYNTQFIVPC